MKSFSAKCDEKSSEFLNTSNNLKLEIKYSDALLALNKSLCYASSNELLGKIYASRALIFNDCKQFKKCHENIELAKSYGHGKELISLEKESNKCSLENNFEDHNPWNFFKISLPTNKKIPFIANCLKLHESWKYGRYIKTDKDLKTGDVVFIEEPFFKMINKEARYKRCANCLKTNLMCLLPCPYFCVSSKYFLLESL